MAKHRGRKTDDADDADGHDETPSNATSGGEAPTPAEGPADLGANEGTAVYPPSPSDSAGEKTDNVPPAKKLPPDPPPGDGADEVTRLRAERDALARVVANLGGNPDEVAKAAVAGLGAEAGETAAPATKRATVAVAGFDKDEVEYPAAAANPRAAALAAWKAKHGVWATSVEPDVHLID